jgi:hypothetical protein
MLKTRLVNINVLFWHKYFDGAGDGSGPRKINSDLLGGIGN